MGVAHCFCHAERIRDRAIWEPFQMGVSNWVQLEFPHSLFQCWMLLLDLCTASESTALMSFKEATQLLYPIS